MGELGYMGRLIRGIRGHVGVEGNELAHRAADRSRDGSSTSDGMYTEDVGVLLEVCFDIWLCLGIFLIQDKCYRPL